ncbi:MAG: hypothetical protein Q9160_003209 [Pyrenula sp. 1 TL-2023]
MQVTALDRPDLPEKMILKVVDSRWLSKAREQNGLPSWSLQREQEYITSVLDGHVPTFWERVCGDDDYWEQDAVRKRRAADNLQIKKNLRSEIDSKKEQGDSDTNSAPNSSKAAELSIEFEDVTYDEDYGELPQPITAEEEACYFADCENEFDAELRAYKGLQELQGCSIPRLYMSLVSEPWAEAAPDIQADWLQCHGLLLEFINGPCLRDLIETQPHLAWGDITRAVTCAVNIFPYYQYIHAGLYARNIILRDGASFEPENFVIIDLSRGTFVDRSGKEEAEERFPFSAWHGYEATLVHDLLCDIPSVRLRQTGRPEEIEYGSCRFRYWFEDGLNDSDYEIREDASEMLIQNGVRRLQEGQSPLENLKEKFNISRKAHRIVWEEQESCDRLHFTKQATYDYQNGWEPKAVKRIATEVMTDENVYCDPDASWLSFCVASVDPKNSQDFLIFEQLPKRDSINLTAPDGPSESRQTPELKEADSFSTSSKENDPSQPTLNVDNFSPSGLQPSMHTPSRENQSSEGHTTPTIQQPSERRSSNEGNTALPGQQPSKQVHFILPSYEQSSAWFTAIRRLSGKLLSNLREPSLRISNNKSALAPRQPARNSADLKSIPVSANNLPLLGSKQEPPNNTTAQAPTAQVPAFSKIANEDLLKPFTPPRKRSTSLASQHTTSVQLDSPTHAVASDPSPSVSPRSDTFSAVVSSASTAPTELSDYDVPGSRESSPDETIKSPKDKAEGSGDFDHMEENKWEILNTKGNDKPDEENLHSGMSAPPSLSSFQNLNSHHTPSLHIRRGASDFPLAPSRIPIHSRPHPQPQPPISKDFADLDPKPSPKASSAAPPPLSAAPIPKSKSTSTRSKLGSSIRRPLEWVVRMKKRFRSWKP